MDYKTTNKFSQGMDMMAIVTCLRYMWHMIQDMELSCLGYLTSFDTRCEIKDKG